VKVISSLRKKAGAMLAPAGKRAKRRKII